MIVNQDVENSNEGRIQNRPAHIERLKVLSDEGRLFAAGPFPAVDKEDPGEAGFTGSLIIAEFNSLEEAEAWASADPYIINGVQHRRDVRPFKKVLP